VQRCGVYVFVFIIEWIFECVLPERTLYFLNRVFHPFFDRRRFVRLAKTGRPRKIENGHTDWILTEQRGSLRKSFIFPPTTRISIYPLDLSKGRIFAFGVQKELVKFDRGDVVIGPFSPSGTKNDKPWGLTARTIRFQQDGWVGLIDL